LAGVITVVLGDRLIATSTIGTYVKHVVAGLQGFIPRRAIGAAEADFVVAPSIRDAAIKHGAVAGIVHEAIIPAYYPLRLLGANSSQG